MWSRPRRHRFFAGAEVLAIVIVLGGGWLWWQRGEPRMVVRSELDLREGVLFVRGEETPFDGRLVENYPGGARKLSIEIHAGVADGISLGWFESGQLEVEEHFVRGLSHGQRTRWYASGRKRCVASVVRGQLYGSYEEWHPNGRKAMEVTYRNGKPDGVARAWSDAGIAEPLRLYRDGVLAASAEK